METMASKGLTNLIKSLTRVYIGRNTSSNLDHIYVSNTKIEIYFAVIETDLRNHYNILYGTRDVNDYRKKNEIETLY